MCFTRSAVVEGRGYQLPIRAGDAVMRSQSAELRVLTELKVVSVQLGENPQLDAGGCVGGCV